MDARGAAGIVALGLLVLTELGCSSSRGEQPATTPAAEPRPDDGLSLLDSGRTPLEDLEYELKVGASERLLVSQTLSLYDSQAETGRATLTAPLWVRVVGSDTSSFSVVFELGPPALERAGDTGSLGFLSDAEANSQAADAKPPLKARVRLTRTGRVESATRLSREHSPLMEPVLDTLLGLGSLPGTAVGVGARWRTRAGFSTAEADTESEFELLSRDQHAATLRVWRVQVSPEHPERRMRSIGEWSLHRGRWPMLGADRVKIAVPTLGVRLSASFRVAASAPH